MGRTKNRDNEGITSQNILIDNSDIFFKLPVSIYSQINASTETNGTDAKIPPQKELRLPISEIVTIRTEDITTFII